MTRGESLKILVDYDLFGVNTKDKMGVYLKTDQTSGKHLVYFFDVEEWGEFEDSWVERVDPGTVSETNAEFVSRVVTLEMTCGS